MYRRVERFEDEGMRSLFATDPAAARARRQGLEPAIRGMIVELKAEYPRLNDNESSNIVYVRAGRRLGKHTSGRVLAEEVVPLKLSRLFEPYHDAPDRREGLPRGEQDGRLPDDREVAGGGRGGPRGPAPGRPKGVRKVDLATMNFIRRMQENPELGAFRVHAELQQKRGAEVSVRTVGRVMAVHRDLYGLGKPKRSP